MNFDSLKLLGKMKLKYECVYGPKKRGQSNELRKGFHQSFNQNNNLNIEK